MQAHLAKPVVLADLARALQRWLPTRIIESAASPPSPAARNRASALAMSPRLVARWQKRRHEAVEAVRSALTCGTAAATADPAASRAQLITLVHKLAGTAAFFGEPDLGDCAAALEYALTHGETNASVEALANDLLMLADSASVPDRQVGGR
jgi:HPt (histidine-containing phosphotransfer) domain-containing protein